MTNLVDRPSLHLVRPPGDEPRRPSGRFVAVAVAVAAILAVLSLLVFGGGSSHRSPAATPKATTPAPAAVTPPAPKATSTACHLSAADQKVPTSPPPVSWDIYDTVALPYSATAGPEYVDGDIARCYAHTPTGALLASIQLSTRYLLAADWRQVLATQVVPGPGVKVYAADRPTAATTYTAGEFCQIAGFSELEYLPTLSRIELVTRCGSNLQAVTATVQWSGTDWKLVLTANGGVTPAVTPIANLTGFVPFGGV